MPFRNVSCATQKRLTMRAADKWDSARFSGLFLALLFFRLSSRVSARPLAASAKPLGGWFNRSILHNSDMPVVTEHMLIHSILPKKEERC